MSSVIDHMHNVEGQKVNGEQCMGKCISTDGFSTTAVPSGKLQHKISYLVNSGGCKMCQVPKTENHVKLVLRGPHTSYTPHYSLGSLFCAVVFPKAPRSSRNRLC